MKNFEKFTIADYYVNLITRLSDNKESFVISTTDIANEIHSLDIELGVKCASKKAEGVRLCLMKQKFAKYFKDYIKEEVLDDTFKGNGSRKIFSVELKPEDRAGLVLKLQNKFKCTKQIYRIPGQEIVGEIEKPTSIVSKEVKKPTLTVKAGKKKAKSIIPGRYLPRKGWLKNFYNLCILAKNDPDKKVSKKQILSTMKLKGVSGFSKLITDWGETLIRGGIICKMDIYISLSKEKYIRIEDPISMIAEIDRKFVDWFGESLSASTVLKTTSLISIKRDIVKPTAIKEFSISYEKAYAIFIMAGLIKKYKKLITFDQMYKLLLDNFNISLSKSDITSLIKDFADEFFDINTHCGNIGINLKSDVNWEEFNEKFSPRNFTRTVISRISMTKEEINKIMPNNKINALSKISDNDFIYEIIIDRSIHSLREICNLYRTFRGTDQLFDQELVKEIENALVYSEARAYNNEYLAYSIEL